MQRFWIGFSVLLLLACRFENGDVARAQFFDIRDPAALAEAVQFLSNRTHLPVMTNEIGQQVIQSLRLSRQRQALTLKVANEWMIGSTGGSSTEAAQHALAVDAAPRRR